MDASNLSADGSPGEYHREEDHFMNNLLNSNLLPMGVFDTHLKLVKTNEAFCHLFGQGKEHFYKKHVLDLSLKKSNDWSKELKKLANSEIEQFVFQSQIDTLGKEEKLVQFKIRATNHNGRFTGGVILIIDLNSFHILERSLKKRLQGYEQKNQLLQAQLKRNLAVENLLHMASHDMKEPLRMIGNFVQLIKRRNQNQLDEVSKEYMGFVLTGVSNINKLIEDIILYTNLDKEDQEWQDIDVADLLLVLNSELESEIQSKNAKICVSPMPKKIQGNWHNLKLVFKQIFLNALKFGKKDVSLEINVQAEDAGSFWQFSISDNGIGMEAEHLEKIFQLFRRLHSKAEYPGSGVGLAMCQKIVGQHGGEIWAESEPAVGSKFYFTIRK